MPSLPVEFIVLMIEFQDLFSKRVFLPVTLMVAGAILAPGTRTIASVLRIMGLSHEHRFHKYHRVLSQARWSPREAAFVLLQLLLRRLAPSGPLIFGLDDTLERRWGKKIKARGIYRDSVRSGSSWPDAVATRGALAVVRTHGSYDGACHRHLPLVPLRQARRADSRGALARSVGSPQTSSALVDESDALCCGDRIPNID